MRTILFCIFLALGQIVCAQQMDVNFENYTSLKCQGEIPVDFKTELSKVVNDVGLDSKSGNYSDRKKDAEFTELSTNQLINILYSGKVLYGDFITTYVNKVADIVLANSPELRGKVRFYVLKHSDLNAYSTESGIIFISIGLLAQIENEAQLAFIICHEITHFVKSHNLAMYKFSKNLVKNDKKIDLQSDVLSMLAFSKDNELEADVEGLKLFLKTPYNVSVLNDLFSVMLYAYLPFEELQFDSSYFNDKRGYVLPKNYFIKKISHITAEEDVSDSFSTHPNIKRRREAINKFISEYQGKEGEKFIVGIDEFKVIQQAARYEVAILFIQNSEGEEALYNGYLIEKIYGKSLFSDKIICSALYSLTKVKNNKNSRLYKVKAKDKKKIKEENIQYYWELVEGEVQAVYYLMQKLPAEELNVLAAKKTLEAYERYEDSFFKLRFDDLISELVNFHHTSFEKFYFNYDNIDADAPVLKDYYNYAFVDVSDKYRIKEVFYKYTSERTKRFQYEQTAEYEKYTRAYSKKVRKVGVGLNLKKFVMLNPYYMSYKTTNMYDLYTEKVKDPKLTPLKQKEIEKSLVQNILEMSKNIGLEVEVIGANKQSEITTDQFNEFQYLINWFREKISGGNGDSYTFENQDMKKYSAKYGHIGFCYVTNVNKSLQVVFVLMDLNHGGISYFYERQIKRSQPDGVYVKMMLYEVLHQIEQNPKKLNRLKKKYKI